MLAAVACFDVVWLLITPLSLHESNYSTLIGLIAGCAALLMASRLLPQLPKIQMLCSGSAITLGAWPILRLFNHLTMTGLTPLADESLATLDEIIHFDWIAYIGWIDGQRWLLDGMEQTYTGLTPYSCVAFLILLAGRGVSRAREFILLFVCTAIITMLIGMHFPARGAMLHYAPAKDLFEHIVAGETGTYFWPPLAMLRSNPNHVLDISYLPGLVAFPSFHTAMGVIMIWCCRGGWGLFVPSLAINSLMIGGVPIYGGHYGIDVIAGAVLVPFVVGFLSLVDSTVWFDEACEEQLGCSHGRTSVRPI